MTFISRLFSFLLVGGLFIVTAHLTVDLVTKLLPDKYWYLPSMSVGAFDGGFIVWGLTLLYVVENNTQRSITWLMIVVDFGGVAICAFADVFLADATKGLVEMIPPDQMRWIVFGVVGVIIVNVAAWFSLHVVSPQHIERTTGRQSQAIRTSVKPHNVTQMRKPKVRVAQTPVSTRRVRQLPEARVVLAQETEREDETEPNEEEEELNDSDEQECEEEELNTEEENAYLEELGDEEETETVPFRERLTNAKRALFPSKSGKKRLPVRK